MTMTMKTAIMLMIVVSKGGGEWTEWTTLA